MSNFIRNYISGINVEQLLNEGISKLISLVLLCLVFYVLKKLLHFVVRGLIKPSLKLTKNDLNRQRTLSRLIENSLSYVLYFFMAYWILSIIGLPVSSLLAGAGIAGVAIGLGAQGFLSDLLNGFFILLEHQFDVGDSVVLTNGPIRLSGKIYSVGVRTTQVRDSDGTLHFIPNRNILVVSNQSRGDMRVQVDLPLPLTANLDKVYRIIDKVNEDLTPSTPIITQAPTIIGPQTLASGQFVLRVHCFVENGKQTETYQLLYRKYQDALREAGITFTAQ